MDLPPLNVNKFQASVDIIRYCEWPKIKKYMNKRIIKAVNECKTQATIAKKFVGQIEKKKWSLKKRSSSKGELEEKYDLDDDEAVSWGSDFDDEEDDDDLDDVENSNANYIVQENCFVQQRAMNDCRNGHYDLSQLNNRYENEEQLLNVGRFERINSPTKNLMNGEIESNHYSSSIITLAKNNLDSNASSMCSSNIPSSASSSGTSSICGGLVGSNDPSTSSNLYSSSSNSSAVDSTKSQSPPPITTSSSKLACKLLAKLLTSSGPLEQNNQNFTFSSPNLQSKTQFNEQLKYALNKKLNELNNHNLKNKLDEDFSKIDKSSSMLKTNHNNNYLKCIDNSNEVVNKSMVDLSKYNNKKEYLNGCLNEESSLVKNKATSSQPKMKIFKNKFNLNNSKTNLITLKSNLTKNLGLKKADKNNSCLTKFDNDFKNSISQKSCLLERNQKQNEFYELDQTSLKNPNDTTNNLVQLLLSQENNDEGLSSGRSSILSSFKFKNSDKSFLLTDSSGSCSSSIKSISLKQLSIKPTVPPKPNITFKDETNRKRKNSKIIRPTNGPPPPPLPAINSNKSPYSSFNSLNEDLISEFTIEEVNEILNCKISDDNDFLNDVDFTQKLLQQQFSQAKSLQHLTDLEKEEQVKTIENGLKLQSKNEKSQSFKKISQNLINENDCITEKNDDKKINTFNTKLESKFENEFDESLNKILINQKLSLKNKKENERKKFNKKEFDLIKHESFKKDELIDNYEKPIKEFEENFNYSEKVNLNTENTFNENTISPPPEFDDQYGLNHKIEKLNEEFKNQVKKHAIFNKNILNNNKWSCVEINSDKNSFKSNLKSNQIESFHHSIKNISLNPSFNLNEEPNSTNGFLSFSTSNIPVDLNRPILPRNKLNAINLNKTELKKLPNKLKSLPEIFTAKINNINYQAINKLNEESKSIRKNITNQSNQLSIHLRPLPELPLEHYDWFHDLEREEATNLLLKFSKEGGFLVRKSKRAGSSNPYSLTIYNNEKIFNLNIRKREDNLFALGKEKEKEKTFPTVPQLIEYHKNEAILLTTKGQNAGMTKLIATPNKI